MNLKDEYNKAFVEKLADDINSIESTFDKKGFKNAIINKDWETKELKERMRFISTSVGEFLPIAYEKQIAILLKIVANYRGLQGMIFPDFVEVYGLKEYKTSIKALETFTHYSSSEFAIRPFIENYQKETIAQLIKWSKHENDHVRRLSSEGARPKLPWASPLREFIKNPEPILPILQNLKDDESEYVRKSVANHLNDISKSQPGLALELGKSWFGITKNMSWVVKHGLRTLLKQGDKQALSIFGFDNAKGIKVERLSLEENSIFIGDDLNFNFEVMNTSQNERNIRLEYKIAYVKANGGTSKKVFQISEFELRKSKTKKFKKKQRFTDFSTRKHYPGEHTIIIVVNGEDQLEKKFNVKG